MRLLNYLWIVLWGSLMISCSSQKSTAEKQDNGTEVSTETAAAITQNGITNINDYKVGKAYEQSPYAVFAGGCFWCIEGALQQIDGIIDVVSGYSGGDQAYPTYHEVGSGTTGHAESVVVFYDPAKLDYHTLLELFFEAHDPTQANGQGPDIGPEYRAIVFYENEEQKQEVEAYIKELNASGKYDRPIVTEVSPYKSFWVAEAYHQDYYEHHPENPYVQNVSKPKVEKIARLFKDLLKK